MLIESIQKYDMFRSPSWRFLRVMQLQGSGHGAVRSATPRDDEMVKRANRIMRLLGAHRSEEAKRKAIKDDFPMYLAIEMHEREKERPEAMLVLQAQLLTDMPFDKIADENSTLVEAVECYESVFFNVRPYLHQRKWILREVLIPAISRRLESTHPRDMASADQIALPFLDGSLKLFAYLGGPVICDFMAEGLRRDTIRNADDIPRFLDEQWSSALKRRSLQAAALFQINKYNVTELFAIHARILEIEKSQESLAWKQNMLERHLNTAIHEIPWTGGSDGAAHAKELGMEQYDSMPAELNDLEVLGLMTGTGARPEVDDLHLPAPTPKEGK